MGNVLQAPLRNDAILKTDLGKISTEPDTNSLFQALLLQNTEKTEQTSVPETMIEEALNKAVEIGEVKEAEQAEETDAADDMDSLNFESWVQTLQQLLRVSDNETVQSLLQGVSVTGNTDVIAEEVQAIVHQLLDDDAITLHDSIKEELLTLLSRETMQISDLNEVVAYFSQSDEATLSPFRDMLRKAEDLLQNIQSSGDVEKHSKALLQLLKQWSHLSQQQGHSSNTMMQTLISNEDVSNEKIIWGELVKTYQKRTKLAENKQYHSDARVSRQDVSKWLQQLISGKQSTVNKGITHQMTGFQSMHMSEIEQYVIHVDEGRQADVQSKQLIDQFQKIIHSSRFSSNINGTSQLSLSLKPDNLGDMVVKLTQIDGEMTAKILVSSQAAKEMLEGNLQQLKHIFSPHQVVIERTDVNLTSQETMNEEGEETQSEHEEQGHSEDSPDEQKDSRDDDFETYMDELLGNEKV